jgi:ddrB-like ParB superfamily domain
VNYEVANLPFLITSHDADFRVNPRYPAQLQPRARDSAPARDQVNSMAARLQPERLGRSPEANSGAPIVGPDNVVESGNGRTLALGKAYSSARAGDYRNWLQSQGVDTGSVQKPILIARRVTPLSPEERVAFTHGPIPRQDFA